MMVERAMTDHVRPFKERVLSELRTLHQGRARLESELALVNAAIKQVEAIAPSIADEYALDPDGSKGLAEAFAGLVDIVTGTGS